MKQPKADVDYSPGHKDSHCGPVSSADRGYCRFFQTKNDTCRKVAGKITRHYWCRLWIKHEPS